MASKDQPVSWRELMRSDDVHLARSIAVSLAAMEFDVRTVHTRSGAIIDWADDDATTTAQQPGHLALEVKSDDWADLQDVLPSLIEEQQSFDAGLDARSHGLARVHRTVLITLILIVAVLGTLRLIDL